MQVIQHRVNTIKELEAVPFKYGVEVDLHFNSSNVFVGHDPFDLTLTFSEFLSHYQHQIIAVNIKEEGIEDMVINCLNQNSVSNFFLFDLSFPSLMRLIKKGEKRIALRVSDFEDIRMIDSFARKVDWLWIDIFENSNFLREESWSKWKDFRKCLVSPELHVERDKVSSENIFRDVSGYKNRIEAICTKSPNRWESL